jgi:hypothetical protein
MFPACVVAKNSELGENDMEVIGASGKNRKIFKGEARPAAEVPYRRQTNQSGDRTASQKSAHLRKGVKNVTRLGNCSCF